MNNKVLTVVAGFLGVVWASCGGGAGLCSEGADAGSGGVGRAPVFNVRDYGAVGDGATLDTAALQAAIEACHKRGEGTVLVPGGHYVAGTIFLKSHVQLYLASSAVILGSKDLSQYATNIARCGFVNEAAIDKCLVYAEHAENISIAGRGTIDGQGGAFLGRLPDGKTGERPMLIRFFQCTNVAVESVALRSAGAWCSHYRECDGVRIHGITIHNRANGNGDGIDLMSTRNVRKDFRPAIVCDDVQDLEVSGFKAQADASVESLIRLRAVQGAFIHDSRPLNEIGTFVRVEGGSSKDVVLAGNDLAHAKQAVERIEGAPAVDCSQQGAAAGR